MTTLLETQAPAAAAGIAFTLTDEQLAVKKMVREFAESEIAPHVMEWDEAQIFPRGDRPEARRAGDAGGDLPRGVRRRGPLRTSTT